VEEEDVRMIEQRIMALADAGYGAVRDRDDPDRAAGLPPDALDPDGTLHGLRVHVDARGALFEAWRRSWFGGEVAQAYVSVTAPGVVKGWHLHLSQTDRFVLVRGRIIVAVYDLRGTLGMQPADGDAVREVALDADLAPRSLTIPPGHAHGWINAGGGDAWTLNLCSSEYDGRDEFRRAAHDGPAPGVVYDWRRRRDG